MQTLDNLDKFTRAYIDAAIWTECNPDSEDLSEKDADDLAPATLGLMIADCQKFQTENSAALKTVYAMQHKTRDGLEDYTPSQAGYDFWLTRNNHGAGFWDRGLGEAGNVLSNRCCIERGFPAVYFYVGDDGKIYQERA